MHTLVCRIEQLAKQRKLTIVFLDGRGVGLAVAAEGVDEIGQEAS